MYRVGALEVVERERHVRLVGDCEEVEHGVRRAAERRRQRNGVLEGVLGHDLAWRDAEPEHLDDGRPGRVRIAVASIVDGRR